MESFTGAAGAGQQSRETAADSSVRLSNRTERSCLRCHQRKVRCDKKSPCASCARMGVLCSYPGPDASLRRPHRITITDVSARLSRLERMVEAMSRDYQRQGRDDQSTTTAQSPDNFEAAQEPTPQEPSSNGVLVNGGQSSRYFNEVLISRVLEEEGEIQHMLASTDADRDDTRFPAFLNVGGILSTSAIENHGFQPTKWQEVQLWQAFVSNVEPLTKILHIPTVQPVVFEAINNPDGTCKNVKALLSAIYFAAATSLQPDDVNHLLGQEKRIAIKMLKQNFEQSLEQANILDSPTLTSLQALAIYLVSFLPRHVADDPAALTSRQLSVRAHNAGRSVWVLNGLAIRLAQSIGLHQDGKSFNLSPFDSEIRRRLWWHLWAKDARASEDHGITVASFDSPPYIHFPLNIDDSQISPSTDKPPTSKRGWSEMTFPLIIMRANDVLQRLYHTVKPPSDDPASEFNRKEALNQLIAQIEEYTQDCNLNIPIQRATQLFGQVLLRKLDFVSRQQLLNQSDSVRGNRESLAAGETLLSACEILELNRQIQTDDILRGFRWTFETYPQYHLLLYVLWYLCVHPTGPIVDRAWNVVEATFDHEIANQRDLIAGPGSKWAVLKLMREKAIHFRDVANNADPAGHTQADSGNLPMADFPAGALDQMETGMLADMVNLDQDAASFLDWGRLVDDFNTHSHTF